MPLTGWAWIVFGVPSVIMLGLAIQNVAQVWVLLDRLIPLRRARHHIDEVVAVSGQLHLIEPVRCGHRECLYYESKQQARDAVAQHGQRGYSTVDASTGHATSGIRDGEHLILVADPPTEVHGLRKSVSTQSGGSAFEVFTGPQGGREIVRWLPIPEELTAVGRLREEGTIVLGRDPAVGLLISPRPARSVALQESLKVVAYLAAIAGYYAFVFHWGLGGR